ncbi:Nucleotide-binding universal stress protein, UspA family [Mesorhizobium albiziae]|uniref:Nucleotide-binding universal stress protein, UspA family n=1 Tax=Neomesorhizobium albiziae TaxID=335020 RepID=A0A1I4EZ15_9HYPH|nr:universal stress protein [Mesorhizobium albiziae]GLS33104.1 universal stress protein [Mesorhizobium albiziae]SFL10972.1 Nucleotide-binding universal stress protein, UspA family [Mesorhizobium albiziae]
MAFKTVLSVTGADHSDQDVRTAASLCAEVGADLSVLVIRSATRPPMGDGIPVWPEQRAQDMARLENRSRQIERLSQGMARLEKQSREIQALLGTMRLSYDVDTDYCDHASVGDVVRQRALCADLTIVGPALLNDSDLGPLVMNGSLFETGKPVLVVPKGAEATLWPQRVLVGWDSRVEASRAVREALDLLSHAKEVRVTLVDPEPTYNGNGAEPGADITAYLARHGVRVVVDRLPSAGQSIDTVLAQHAIDTSADMIVMGAYGHRRLRERIFGGVARWILEKPPLPLFLAR